MQNTISTIATIRQRGQLTIPDKIRERFTWTEAASVVRLSIQADNKIIVEPYRETKFVDWKALRRQLKRVVKYKGERGNLSQFIVEDRERH